MCIKAVQKNRVTSLLDKLGGCPLSGGRWRRWHTLARDGGNGNVGVNRNALIALRRGGCRDLSIRAQSRDRPRNRELD